MTNLQIGIDSHTIEQIFSFGFLGFLATMVLTPFYTTAAYRGRWWKKSKVNALYDEKSSSHQKNQPPRLSRNIPTMAGVVFVLAICLVTIAGNLKRTETWLPLAAMLGAAVVGLFDDIINIRGIGRDIINLRVRLKSTLLIAIAFIGGWWFFAKLDVSSINVPFYGDLHVGWLIVPLFIFVVYATANAVSITDGLDGLAGGLAAIAFGAYAIISIIEKKYGLAGFCMTVVGALLSYTWFNIYPARFFMGNTGSFALGTALGVVALLTNTIFILPILGVVFVTEAGSTIIQFISQQLRGGKKIFLSTPLHRHFEASGWPQTKITMRFWVIGEVAAFLGVIVYILGRL